MHITTAHVVGVCLALSSSASWAVHRCTGPDGKVLYQAEACEGGKKVDLTAAGNPAPEVAARSNLMNAAILRGEPFVGMTEAELVRVMGRPVRANTGDYGSDTHDQLIYERRGQTVYVYVSNGVVRSIQRTQAPAHHSHSEPSGEPQQWCPSGLTLRNMETSASSRSLSDMERAQRLRELQEIRRRCG